jgi:ketosteroid isomerase-like protein
MPDPQPDLQRRESIGRFFAAIQAGDRAVLEEVLTPDAITRWPQSGERMTDAMSCIRVYENYPGGRRVPTLVHRVPYV